MIRPSAAAALRPAVQAPEAVPPPPSPYPRVPRFRVRLPYTLAIPPPNHRDDSDPAQSTFRFLGNVPEPGPFPAVVYRYPANFNSSGFDSVNIGYEFSERLAAEAEVVFGQWSAARADRSLLDFTSTLDGTNYETHSASIQFSARFTAALFGLTYRPAAPTEFRRHMVEAGLAVGPAWARLGTDESFWQTALRSGKATLAARVHVAYDFYITPKVSLGVAAGYRYFRVDLEASPVTAIVGFHDAVEEKIFFERMTEWTIPEQTVDASGFYIGLRTGLRF